MATLKKFDLKGKEIGQVNIADELANAEANGQMVKDYIIALRANARQWSANTKGRSEVNHTTKKPHPQKGGGRSRQGSLAAPQYKGGGRVFGPKPKFDQHVRINKKERQAAIRFLIAEKIKENRIHVLDKIDLKAPKTKTIADFLKGAGLEKRVLFLGAGTYADIPAGDSVTKVSIHDKKHDNFSKSIRNIPRVEFALAKNVNGYHLLVAHDIVITEEGLNELKEWLC